MGKMKIRIDNNLLIALLFFALIFVSNDTLLFGTNANKIFFYVHILILAMALFFLVIIKRVLITDMALLYIASIMAAGIAITMLVNRDFGSNSIKYIYTFFEIGLAFFIVNRVPKQKFRKYFVNIMYFLAWFSIGLFLFSIFAYPLIKYAPAVTNESGLQYYWFGFGFLESLSPTTLPRMYGIFREPGVNAVFLLLALMMEFFLKNPGDKIDPKKVVVLAVAVFLTFSTAAVILEFVILAVYSFSSLTPGKRDSTKVIAILLLLILAALLYFGQNTKVFHVIFGKLFTVNSSASSRFGSFYSNYLIFRENPITGKGWSFVEDNFLYYSAMAGYGKIHDTNTVLKYTAIYGIVPTILLLVGSFRFFDTKKVSAILVVIVYMALLSNEDLTVNIILYIIAFYGYYNNKGQEIYESIAD